MRTPRHLLRDSVTLTPAAVTVEAGSAAPEWAYTGQTATTVMGRLQPLSASDSMVYGRETGTTIYQLFLSPVDVNGTALSFTDAQWKTMRVRVGSTNYRVDGPARNPDNDDCVLVLNLEKLS